jgi:cell division protein FtsQ
VNRCDTLSRSGSRGFASGMLIVVLLFLATAGGVAWVSLGIVANDRWPIRWLEVNGSFQRVSAEQLRASLLPMIDVSFFTIDLQQLKDAARRNAWVSDVRVQKAWPDTVRVTVKEFEPLAHWNRGQLISRRGEAFAVPEADGIQGLPWLEGPEGRLDDVLSAWSDFSEKLLSLDLEIRNLTLDRRGAWSMVLNNGTRVRLGRDATGERFRRFLLSWDLLAGSRDTPPQDIDMRYTNGLAVVWPQHLEKERGADS